MNKKLSRVEVVLIEEYYRALKRKLYNDLRIKQININGSLCIKNIHNKSYNYFQWKENGKSKSRYLSDEDAKRLSILIVERNERIEENRVFVREMKCCIRGVGKKTIDAHYSRYSHELDNIKSLFDNTNPFLSELME